MNYLCHFLIAFLFILCADVFALFDTVSTGIKFEHGLWSEITAKATRENKMIFLDAFASWCSPCKWMSKNIFPNDTVGAFYNQYFISAKIDMEKGEGIELAKKFGVKAYPTFLYISPDGESLIHRTCGSTSADNFIQNGRNALDPETQLITFKKRFESGSSDPKEAYKYFEMMNNACMDNEKEVSAYLKTQRETDLTSPDNWKIIFSFLNDPASKEFKYLLSHKKDFESSYNKELVNKKIADVYNNGLSASIKNGDSKAYENLKKEIKKNNVLDGEQIILNAELARFKKAKDWKNYARTAEALITKFIRDDAAFLNKVSWTVYENITDKSVLQKAAEWAKRATDLQNIYAFNDTYASILFKLGKKSEARDAALKAIELAKKENADAKETEELLEKINQIN